MFTGIITEVGRVAAVTPIANGVALQIEAPESVKRLTLGASIAISGCCQTVVDIRPPRFTVQAVGATLERTTFGRLRAGDRVNLEPSLRLGDELGGHLVTGHVDGVGRVEEVEPKGDATFLTVSVPPELAHYVALRGSISLDGVSLTVAGLSGARVTISIIPHTLKWTIIGGYRAGDPVNIEVDLLARYLERMLTAGVAGAGGGPGGHPGAGRGNGPGAGADPLAGPDGPPGAGRRSGRLTLDMLKEKFS